MNGYICFYKGMRAEIRAETTRAAQLQAAALWRVKPSQVYKVSATLCEKADGSQVIHVAID